MCQKNPLKHNRLRYGPQNYRKIARKIIERNTHTKKSMNASNNYLCNDPQHGLWTPNEGINQRYLKNWADVADKIGFGRT